jgi:hypothetical protein
MSNAKIQISNLTFELGHLDFSLLPLAYCLLPFIPEFSLFGEDAFLIDTRIPLPVYFFARKLILCSHRIKLCYKLNSQQKRGGGYENFSFTGSEYFFVCHIRRILTGICH